MRWLISFCRNFFSKLLGREASNQAKGHEATLADSRTPAQIEADRRRERAIKGRQPASLASLLPIRDFPSGDNVMVRTDGCYVAGYKIRGSRTYFADASRRNEVNMAIDAMLRTLPEESMRVQVRYEVSEDASAIINAYEAMRTTTSPDVEDLDRERVRMWRKQNEDGEFLARTVQLFFIWDPDIYQRRNGKGPAKSGGFSLSLKKNIQVEREYHESLLNQFNALLDGAQSVLAGIGFQPLRMNGDELFTSVAKAISPLTTRVPRLHPQSTFGRYVSPREQLAYATIQGATDQYLVVDNLLWSFISVKTPPDETYPGVLRDLLTLGVPMVISTQVVVSDQKKILDRYQKRQKRMLSAQNDGRGGRRVDVSAAVAANELEEIQARIMSSATKACRVSLCIAVRTSTPAVTSNDFEEAEKELAVRCQKVLHALATVGGSVGLQESEAQTTILINTLPGLALDDKRDHDLLSSHAADLCPLELPWEGTPATPLMLLPTPYRQLIPYSPFDPSIENANGLVIATSGSGKSVAISMMLLAAARRECRISIIERGNSYEDTIRFLGGEMITMSLDSDRAINPFDLDPGEVVAGRDQEAFLVTLLHHMVGESTNVDSDILDQVLARSIRDAYHRVQGTSTPVPRLTDVHISLQHYVDRRSQISEDVAKLAATKMEKWVGEGIYANLFDRHTTVKLSHPAIYFDVSKLSFDPRLEGAMSLLIAHATTKRAYGMKHIPSITIVDEGWSLLRMPRLGQEFEGLSRTARKSNGCIWLVSQAAEDFTGTPDNPNPVGPALLATTATRLIGRQRADSGTLRDKLHLSEPAIDGVQNLPMTQKGRQSYWILSVGENPEMTHPIILRATPKEKWITTTFPRERNFKRWFEGTNKALSLAQCIALLAQRFPDGLADMPEQPEEKSGAVKRFCQSASEGATVEKQMQEAAV